MSKERPLFQKSALANYSDEIFTIVKAMAGDEVGEAIEGRFYREELQPVEQRCATCGRR